MTLSETERKLAQYRARKEKEKLINHYKNQANSFLTKLLMKKTEKVETKKEDLSIQCSSDTSENELSDSDNHTDLIEEEPSPWTVYDYLYYLLWFLMWSTIYAIFIKFQFGTVYLILSGLIGIFLNTRTGPKKKDEVSAYSVFNKNCEKIDGTLDGEQMTKQMLYGGFAR